MSNEPTLIGSGIWIDQKKVIFGKNVTIGHCSCIGYPEDDCEGKCTIMDDVKIGAFCIISIGTELEKGVTLQHYCRVDCQSKIGEGTELLYGSRVHFNVKIGKNCLISGNCPDNTIVGNNVKHFGRLVHIPGGGAWHETSDPAPIIEDDVFIGANAVIVGGVTIKKGAQIGANAVVIGNGRIIGEGSKIGAGEIVRQDLPANTKFYDGRIRLN
jgi:acetyltransferase-like isoleucine patch superfamily enzyme